MYNERRHLVTEYSRARCDTTHAVVVRPSTSELIVVRVHRGLSMNCCLALHANTLLGSPSITTTTILFLRCRLSQTQVGAGEEDMNVEEIGNHARGRIKAKGRCTVLSPPNFTLIGYSPIPVGTGKYKTMTTGDLKRVAACCQKSKIQ